MAISNCRWADWSSLPIEVAGPGVLRQTFHGDQCSVIRYVYSPGAIFANHAHPEEQTTIVLTGQIAFTIDDVEQSFGPGDCLLAKANVPHGARVIGDITVESINVLSPRRNNSPGSR